MVSGPSGNCGSRALRHSRCCHVRTTIPRRHCPRDWTHPPCLRACSLELWLVGEGNPDAQQPRPALCCLRGGESELHAPSAPPPPDFSRKIAFSWSLSSQDVLDSSLNSPRGAETHITCHRSKTINNSRVHSPAGETGYLNSENSSEISPIRLDFQMTLALLPKLLAWL